MVATQTNIPLQLQEYKTHLITVDTLQIALFSSKVISEKSGVQHTNITRNIKKLIKSGLISKFSHLNSEVSNIIPLYKISTYSSRGKELKQYELNHKALDLFIQSMNGTKGLQARTVFSNFTEHALATANQLSYEQTALYIETRDETKELAKEFNESVLQLQKLATLQGSSTSVQMFEMSYNKLIKNLIIGKVKGSWRDHTDKIELPLLHLLLRTGIATINHHLQFEDNYKDIYQGFKSALYEVMDGDYE